MVQVSVPLLLISMSVGYGVLVLANRQERPLDKLGRIVGGLTLLVSFVGLIGIAVYSARCMSDRCHTGGAKMACSYHSSAPAESAPSTTPQ